MVRPSLLGLLFIVMASVVVPLRPSSEHILIVRAPGAVGHTDFLNRFFPSAGGGLVESPTARIERALFHRARSASTGDSPGHPLSLLTALSPGPYNPFTFLSATD
jgi:hypothetical protein